MANKTPTRPPPDLAGRTEAAREAAAELREATRAAHEATAGLRELVRDGRALLEQIGPMVEDAYGQQVAEGLDRYKDTLAQAIDKAEQAVYARFDQTVAALLGDDMRDGERLEDALRRFLDRQRALAAFVATNPAARDAYLDAAGLTGDREGP